MLIKTHLAITVFFILLFINAVNHDIIFVIVSIFATFLPDIDSRFSTIGKSKINRILQFFTKHRGVIHSFTFLILITLFFALYLPIVAFGFFLGYGLHLFADSLTESGIRPFWPSKKILSGGLRTGKKLEKILLFALIIVDLLMLGWRVSLL